MDAPAYDRQFDARHGGAVRIAPELVRVTAGNTGPFTFTGTNSFLIGSNELMLVDPGPQDTGHLSALMAAIGGRTVRAILLTHTHKDHSRGAKALVEKTGAPLWFGGPHRNSRPSRFLEFNPIASSCDWELVPDRALADGQIIEVDGQSVEVLATPGHCANHLSFGLKGTPFLLSGDHLMGWNSTLVAVPDGSMSDYLQSLQKLEHAGYDTFLPAHGGAIENGPAFARAMRLHRLARNKQILEHLAQGPAVLGTLVKAVYPGISGRIGFAARMTLAAHLEYLAQQGEISLVRIPPTLWARKL